MTHPCPSSPLATRWSAAWPPSKGSTWTSATDCWLCVLPTGTSSLPSLLVGVRPGLHGCPGEVGQGLDSNPVGALLHPGMHEPPGRSSGGHQTGAHSGALLARRGYLRPARVCLEAQQLALCSGQHTQSHCITTVTPSSQVGKQTQGGEMASRGHTAGRQQSWECSPGRGSGVSSDN